jgi:DNA-binding NarL/FixJ family response regulator
MQYQQTHAAGSPMSPDFLPESDRHLKALNPLEPQPAATSPNDSADLHQPSSAHARRDGTVTTRVLLADNHILIRGGLRALLATRDNLQICGEASNGRDAVDLAVRTKPDVVIINLNLPSIGGIEATRQIRKAAPDTEVLIFTTQDSADLMREALRSGARGYLLKSAPDDQIVAAIEAIGRHQTFCSSSVSEKLLEQFATRARMTSDVALLTNRERQVVRLVASGYTGKRIAQTLGVSLKTVNTHRACAMRKLHLRSVADVVRYAVREKLIECKE